MGKFSVENAAPGGAWKILAAINYKYVAPDGAKVRDILHASKKQSAITR